MELPGLGTGPWGGSPFVLADGGRFEVGLESEDVVLGKGIRFVLCAEEEESRGSSSSGRRTLAGSEPATEREKLH